MKPSQQIRTKDLLWVKDFLASISELHYSSVLNRPSVPNSTHGSGLRKSTLQIVLMAKVCDFSTIRIVLDLVFSKQSPAYY